MNEVVVTKNDEIVMKLIHYFITEKVDSKIITDLIAIMEEHHVTFINTADVFRNVIDMREKEYFLPHLIKIPNDRKYGISTESAIWEKYFLLSKIGSSLNVLLTISEII